MPRRSNRRSRDENDHHNEEEEAEFNDEEVMEEEHQVDNGEDDNNVNDDDENENEESNNNNNNNSNSRQSRRNRNRNRTATAVMSSSKQTDEERRILRGKQRKLFVKMTDSSTDISDKMADVDSQVFQNVRKENNRLWNNVRYTREAVLDGDNVEFISARATRQVDKLISVPRYSADRLCQKLREKCSIETQSTKVFDWKTFGQEAGSCFNSLPTYCSFLNGPIDAEYKPKERKKPVRRVVEEDDAEEEEVDTVNQKSKNKDDNKLSAVEKQINKLNKVLKKRDEEEKGKLNDLAMEYEGKLPEEMEKDEKKRFMKRVKRSHAMRPCAVQFVVNPNSFTQTVENLFGLSFAVKKGDAEVGVRTYEECKQAGLGTVPGPYVKSRPRNESETIPARQTIVTFNMQDWRDLAEAYNVEKGDIPHRGGKSKRNKVHVNEED